MPQGFRRAFELCRSITVPLIGALHAQRGVAQVLTGQPPAAPAVVVAETRYTTAGTTALVAGRIAPRWAVVEETTEHTGDWAAVIGVGPRFAGSQGAVLVLAGPVLASGIWSAALFVHPSGHAGPLSGSGTLEFFFPVERGDVFGFELSHARIFGALSSHVRVGTFLQEQQTARQRPRPELGPTVALRLARGLDFIADAAFGLGSAASGERIISLQWEH